MPVPWSKLAEGVGSSIRSNVIVPAMNEVANIISTQAKYQINRLTTIFCPQPGDVLNAIVNGHLTLQQASHSLNRHGVDPSHSNWPGVIENLRAWPGVDDTVNAYYREAIDFNTASKWVQANGLTNPHAYQWAFAKPHIWSFDACRTLYQLGHIDNTTYEKWLKAGGLRLEEDRQAWFQLYHPLPADMTLRAWNRNIINSSTADKWLTLSGLNTASVRDAAKQLRFEIPSPSNLVGFAVKEVWNRDVVTKFGYDDEFDSIPEFKYWMDRLGYGGDPNIPGGAPGGPTTWAQAYWRQHWKNPAVGQVYEMMHRLRPTGGPNGGPRIPFVPGTTTAVTPVTMDDVTAILKINDFPPYWRAKLAALSFRVLRLVDIRRIARLSLSDPQFKLDAIGANFTVKQWIIEQYRDRGQTPDDANALAEYVLYEAEQANSAAKRRVDRQLAERNLKLVEAEYKVGVISASDALHEFTAGGYDTAQAAKLVDIIDRERKLKCTLDIMTSVKTPLTKGKMAKSIAKARLQSAGLDAKMADFWVACWSGLLSDDVTLQTTAEIIKNFHAGLMTEVNAISALVSLGWSNAGSLLNDPFIEQFPELSVITNER